MNPEPTHDFDRDVSATSTGRSNYNLTASDRPEVIATNPMRRAGHGRAEREDNGVIASGGNTLVIARSGNQGWDEDVYDAVGGIEDEALPDVPCLGADPIGVDPGTDIVLAKIAGVAAVAALVYFLFIDKDRIR